MLIADAAALILVLAGVAMAGWHIRARPGRAGRLGGGLPAALGALLPLGPAPAAARAGGRKSVSTHETGAPPERSGTPVSSRFRERPGR
jgi:hypothetical protein